MARILDRLLESYQERFFWGLLAGENNLHLATQAELQNLANHLNLRYIEVHSARNRVHTVLIGFRSPYVGTGFTPSPIETTSERFRGWGYFTEIIAIHGGYRSIATYIPRVQYASSIPDPDSRQDDSIRVSAVHDGACDISLTNVNPHNLARHLNDRRVGAVMNSVASLYHWV